MPYKPIDNLKPPKPSARDRRICMEYAKTAHLPQRDAKRTTQSSLAESHGLTQARVQQILRRYRRIWEPLVGGSAEELRVEVRGSFGTEAL